MDFKKYKYRTELHAHTNPASPCSDFEAKEVVMKYAELGYDSLVVSNHFFPDMQFVEDKNRCICEYLKDYDEAQKVGEKLGINVILGCEMRFTENHNDYLVYGIDRDFFELAYDNMDKGLESFSQQVRGDDTVLIQAHPFRDWCVVAPAELLDGVEVYNLHPGHNSKVGLAAKYAQSNDLLVTSGTDFHHEGHQGMTALLTKEELKTSFDVARVLKSRDYLIEVSGSVIVPFANLK